MCIINCELQKLPKIKKTAPRLITGVKFLVRRDPEETQSHDPSFKAAVLVACITQDNALIILHQCILMA